MVDQHLADSMRSSDRMKGCRTSAGRLPFESGSRPDESVIEHCTMRADAPFCQPLGDLAIVRSEAPVLMDHQPRFVSDFRYQHLGLWQRRRQRLLAKHRQAEMRGGANSPGVDFARRGDIDRIDCAACEQCINRFECGGHSERPCALLGTLVRRIDDCDDARTLVRRLPRQQMMLTHHASSNQSDASHQGQMYPLPLDS